MKLVFIADIIPEWTVLLAGFPTWFLTGSVQHCLISCRDIKLWTELWWVPIVPFSTLTRLTNFISYQNKYVLWRDGAWPQKFWILGNLNHNFLYLRVSLWNKARFAILFDCKQTKISLKSYLESKILKFLLINIYKAARTED